MSVVAAIRPRLGSRWSSFEAWVGTRSSAAALFTLALAVFAVESAVLPVYPGRDMSRYLQAFVQLGYHVPVYPAVLNTRGPLAALGVGVPLELSGWVAEVVLGLLFALSIVAWGRVALTFGARAAAVTSALLLLDPGYGILFHQLASDALFAAAFAAWALLLARALVTPTAKGFLLSGAAIGVLILVRPGNQVLLATALLPLLLRAAPWLSRLRWAAASFIPSVFVIQAWDAFAQLRYGSAVTLKVSPGLIAAAVLLAPVLAPAPWRRRLVVAAGVVVVLAIAAIAVAGRTPATYARTVEQNASNQFLYRAFELDRIIAPENGPASRRLAAIVRRDLLPREPYRSYGVDVHEFFASGSDRVFGDLTGVAPPADLAAATREAIRKHPQTFVSSIGRTFWEEVARRPVYAPAPSEPLAAPSSGTHAPTDYVVVHGRRLPKPSEGQPIPASAIGPMLWTPGGTAQEVWTSPTEHRTVVSDARDRRRIAKFEHDVARLDGRIPTRDGSAGLVHRLNQASHAFPPAIAWLLVGLGAFALRRPRRALVALAPAAAGVVVLLLSALVAPSVAEYGAPVSPAFILLTTAGLGGVSRRDARVSPLEEWRQRLAPLWPVLGALVGAAAAAWTVKIYLDALRKFVDGAGPPHDLAVFLTAAGKVLHGASPYAYDADRTFAYPPLLAWIVAPLHPVDGSAAAIVWTLVGLAAVGVALWLLGVRDWRCYAIVGVFEFTRSSIDLGTIEPLLLLLVAAAWRWRERLVDSSVAIGAAIVLKLFLWPLVIWHALMKRRRTAVVSLGAALVLGLVTWGAIGFAGLADYPGVLRRLADDEATSSYSVVALGVRAHLPLVAARIVSAIVAVALLVAAAWVARDERPTVRNRDAAVLTLTIAAALAASPIVWVHYFLLLLVPLALARPRFSPLWLVPLVSSPLGEAAWPAGDGRKLGIALAMTLVVLAVALVEFLPRNVLRRARW